MPTQAAQVIIAVIPIVGIVMGSLVLFFSLLWSHREKMAMIDRGSYVPPRFELRVFSLLTGILLLGVGAALTVLFGVLDGLKYSLLGGVIPLVLGVGLLVFVRIAPPHGPEA